MVARAASYSTSGHPFRKENARNDVVRSCEAFIRMCRPHKALEDKVLFPTLRQLISSKRLKELGEHFEEEENRLFGDEGFEKTVEQVATVEKQLGIHDLIQFTAKRGSPIQTDSRC